MRKFLCILSILFCAPAWAGVVYNWQTVSTSPTMDVQSGRIEIKDSAWLSGGFLYAYPNDCTKGPWPGCSADPDSPIISFAFSGATLNPSLNMNFMTGTGFPFPAYQTYSLSFKGAAMSGWFVAYNGETYAEAASGASALWTVTEFISDGGYTCGPGSSCSGATGRWVLDRSTIPVPLPGSLGLIALGAAALGFVARRR